MNYKTLVIFLLINFAALAIGGFYTGDGVNSDWYLGLEKAPWNPPGWVFGAAWTTIMICFSIYMMYAWEEAVEKKRILTLFILQWILNVSWNPVFFKFHEVLYGLITISLLTILVGYFFFGFTKRLRFQVLFVLPYFLWLIIATSLNAYILMYN